VYRTGFLFLLYRSLLSPIRTRQRDRFNREYVIFPSLIPSNHKRQARHFLFSPRVITLPAFDPNLDLSGNVFSPPRRSRSLVRQVLLQDKGARGCLFLLLGNSRSSLFLPPTTRCSLLRASVCRVSHPFPLPNPYDINRPLDFFLPGRAIAVDG